MEGLAPRSYSWTEPFGLNQGKEGACVGHGGTSEAANKPDAIEFSVGPLPDWARRTMRAREKYYRNWIDREQACAQAFAFDIYDELRRNWDEWPGMDYDGTSLAALAKLMKHIGFWPEYRWTDDWDVFRTYVSRHGPGVIATPWKTKMFKPSPTGYLEVSGKTEGWHCVMINKCSLKKGGLYVPNSWGGAGAGWIPDEGGRELVSEGAELLMPVRRPRRAR